MASTRPFFAVIALFGLGACAEAEAQSGADRADAPPRTLSVTGEGAAAGSPDMAMMSFGVVSTADEAGAAVTANAETMTAVRDRLGRLGVADRDMQTANYSLTPQYYRDGNNRADRLRITGYEARNQLTVRLRDVSEVGDVIDGAIAAGANDLGGLSFGFQDQADLIETARRRAVQDARATAEILADEAGVTLGEVMTMSLQQSYGRPQPVAMARMEAADVSTPIEAGESSLRAVVNVTFSLD